jgi:hypothetical protein
MAKYNNLTLTKKYHYGQNPALMSGTLFWAMWRLSWESAIFAVNERIIKGSGASDSATPMPSTSQQQRYLPDRDRARSAGGSIGSKYHSVPDRF